MKTTRNLLVLGFLAIVAACVTINVYFPEAAAEDAADRFIDKVIGPEAAATEPDQSAFNFSLNPIDWIFPAAHAQANIDINTPAIRAIQQRMEQRFGGELKSHFDSGAVGLTNDAMIEIRDLSQVSLAERNKVKSAVSAENSDRAAVYREIAVANGHPEWEEQIRRTFAERWIAKAPSGWYYQNSGGSWVQK